MIRKIAIVAAGLSLSACSTPDHVSIFDPAPVEPQNTQITDQTLLTEIHAKAISKAADGLNSQAQFYANARNDILRQEMLFDIPALGLAAATVANGIFGGTKNVTLGLGLGSATIGGGKLYFSPQARITAYHTAYLQLSCAKSVATSVANVSNQDYSNAKTTNASLIANIQTAGAAIVSKTYGGKTLSTDDSSKLLTAWNAAVTAQQALATAVQSIDGGVMTLQQAADKSRVSATDAVVTNAQKSFDAALAMIKAANPSSTPAATTSTGPGAGPEDKAAAPTMTIDQLIAKLQQDTNQAQLITTAINNAWSPLAACETKTSS